jgi:CBS domain-containing protein
VEAQTILAVKGDSVFHVKPDSPISEAVRMMHEKKIGSVLVMENEEGPVLGILSERDIIRIVAEHSCTALQGVVADVMTRDIMACTSDCTISTIISGMGKYNVRHLPVYGGDKLLGVISARDVMHIRIQQLESGVEPRFQRWFSKGKVYSLGS